MVSRTSTEQWDKPQMDTNPSSPAFICPNCQHVYRMGELVCPNCGIVFDNRGATQKKENDKLVRSKGWPGDASLSEQKPVIFDMDDQWLSLPFSNTLIIGRDSGVDSDPQPDIPLNAFGAVDKGVSRLHLQLRRKGNLLYITDLGSTNGTFLNGRRVVQTDEQLIRDGDELRLSHLKVIVRFPL